MFTLSYFVKYSFTCSFLFWFLHLINNMDEPLSLTEQFLVKLEESFKKFDNLLKKQVSDFNLKVVLTNEGINKRYIYVCKQKIQLQGNSVQTDGALKNDFFDNTSKASSGYGDEEFNECEPRDVKQIIPNDDKLEDDHKDIIIISDDEDYNEILELFDSSSSEDEAYTEDTETCSSYTQKKKIT